MTDAAHNQHPEIRRPSYRDRTGPNRSSPLVDTECAGERKLARLRPAGVAFHNHRTFDPRRCYDATVPGQSDQPRIGHGTSKARGDGCSRSDSNGSSDINSVHCKCSGRRCHRGAYFRSRSLQLLPCRQTNKCIASDRGDRPDFQEIANTKGMTATALRVFLTASHPKMPNLILTPEQIADVTAYILSLREGR